jgi:LmbE family N-acetylglucosaminyl deacetylase
MRVLVLAPHPDDETLGVGGTILRHVADGDEVHLLVMTETYPPLWQASEKARRQDEARAAAKVLGLAGLAFAGFPTMRLNTVPAIEVAGRLIGELRRLNPDVVYAPPVGDVNQDHEATFKAALVACRPLPGCTVRRLLCYEIPPTARFSNPIDAARWLPNTYVDITSHIEQKLAAMECYQSELRQPPHPRSLEGIRLYARERGLTIGLQYAEVFDLIREIR